jgi:hypothetical protein
MPKSAKRFSDNIMLQLIRIDHVYDFESFRSKIIVIFCTEIYPRPTNGILVAITVMNNTFESSERLAI